MALTLENTRILASFPSHTSHTHSVPVTAAATITATRTSTSTTAQNRLQLGGHLHGDEQKQRKLTTIMRIHGVRRENTKKNTGRPQ